MPATINHIALIVRDPKRTATLFESLFGMKSVLHPATDAGSHSQDLVIKLGGVWFVLAQGEPAAQAANDHVAFTVAATELSVVEERLTGFGLTTKRSRAGSPAESLYFMDFDNHLFELTTREIVSGAEL